MLYDKSISTICENGKRLTLIGLTIPLLLEGIFGLLYGTVNTVILSGYSDMAVSATGVAQSISSLSNTVLNMVSKGTVILASVAMGSGDTKRVRSIAGTGMFMMLGCSMLLATVLVAFSNEIMQLMGLSGQLHEIAVSYLRTIGIILPITAMFSYVNNLLICYGYSKVTMLCGLLSNVLNVFLCWFALYSNVSLPITGVVAVAVCTGIAQTMALAKMTYFFFRKRCLFRFAFLKKEALQIVKFGAPAGMSLISYSLSSTITTSFITGLGVAAINTKIYLISILNYTSKISFSLGNAGGILIGRHRGAGRFDRIKRLYRQNIRIAIICNMIVSMVVLIFHRQLLSIFTDDPNIIAAGGILVLIDFAVEIPRAVNHISEYAFNSTGEVYTPLITATISAWLCNVLMSYIFVVVLDWALIGIWLAMIIDELFKAVVYLRRWRVGKWQGIRL